MLSGKFNAKFEECGVGIVERGDAWGLERKVSIVERAV